jgi:peptide/nickel transport system substrate-binding protein
VQIAEILQANLADAGITIDIQQEADAAYDARMSGTDWHFAIYKGAWSWRAEPAPHLRTLFHSKSTYFKGPVTTYADPDVDRLIDAGEAESNVDKRKAIYAELSGKLNQLGVAIFTYQEETILGVSKKVGGWVHRADNKHRFEDMWLV